MLLAANLSGLAVFMHDPADQGSLASAKLLAGEPGEAPPLKHAGHEEPRADDQQRTCADAGDQRRLSAVPRRDQHEPAHAEYQGAAQRESVDHAMPTPRLLRRGQHVPRVIEDSARALDPEQQSDHSCH